MTQAAVAFAKSEKEQWEKVIQWDWQKISDPFTRRQFKFLSKLGDAALPDDEFKRYTQLGNWEIK